MEDLVQKIKELKEQKNAVILAHYYTRPEIQDIADYLGDSLGLAREAEKTTADIIVFCGVHFMAETASVVSPDKKVLIPALKAGCSLAESITVEQLKEWKTEHPGAIVVSYVNTTAAIKAESDYCCTSSNALKIVESIAEDKKILFLPDKNLGGYIKKMTGRDMEIWGGDCCVHERIDAKMIFDKLAEYPDADVLIHPESSCSHDDAILAHPQTFMYSTAGIITHAKNSNKKNFIIATENETIHKLKKDNPDKNFIEVSSTTLCASMKKVSLEKLYEALLYEQYEVKVPEELAKRALLPIQRMLEIG